MKMIWASSGVLFLILSLPTFAQAHDTGAFAGMSVGSSDDDILNEEDNGYKLFVGYRFDRNFAGEIAFIDLGDFSGGAIEQYGVAVDLMAIAPLSNNFELFGKLGLFSWTVEYPFSEDEGSDLMYGFGAQFHVAPQLSVRVEYEEFLDVSGGDVSLTSAGLSYRF